MSRLKAFIRDRDAAMRSLDRATLDKFLKKWNQTRPREWIGDAWLIAMHKARLQIDTFTPSEKAVSKLWLASHGHDDAIGTSRQCPACGRTGPSKSDCFVCGVAT